MLIGFCEGLFAPHTKISQTNTYIYKHITSLKHIYDTIAQSDSDLFYYIWLMCVWA